MQKHPPFLDETSGELFGRISEKSPIDWQLELPTPSPSNLNEVYKRFTLVLKTAAKASIPRGSQKSYIPTWDDECVGLQNEHHATTGQDWRQKAAASLFDYLNEK